MICICINSKNEKIIKMAFLLITTIMEIGGKKLNNEIVTKFLNICLTALRDEDIWQTNKIDAINTVGAISM